MEALINKNVSEIDRIQSSPSNQRQRKVSKSSFYQLTNWLRLIKRWQDDSAPEVCKHMRQYSSC